MFSYYGKNTIINKVFLLGMLQLNALVQGLPQIKTWLSCGLDQVVPQALKYCQIIWKSSAFEHAKLYTEKPDAKNKQGFQFVR